MKRPRFPKLPPTRKQGTAAKEKARDEKFSPSYADERRAFVIRRPDGSTVAPTSPKHNQKGDTAV